MRLDNEQSSNNVEDRRSDGGGFGAPGGGGGGFGGGGRGFGFPGGIPVGGRGGFSFRTIILLVIVYFLVKWVFGIDLLSMLNGGSGMTSSQQSQYDTTDTSAPANTRTATNSQGGATDPAMQFVGKVMGSTERVWTQIFQDERLGTYQKPSLVVFTNFVQSGCGSASSQTGPFYCPADGKIYLDLSFYNELKNRLGAPGDAAQAYVLAHEVGHHVQNLLGIADKVSSARMRASETDANALQVRMELQADCFAGMWANVANQTMNILEPGDVEEAVTAASAIGDDKLQKQARGYVEPDSFTHGTSAQRMKWLNRGLAATNIQACDTFSAGQP